MRVSPRSFRGSRNPNRGFTLIELMVTLAIFALVAAAVTLVLMQSAKSKQQTTQHIESEQGARSALDLMSRDIRCAGYGTDMDYLPAPQPAIEYVDSKEIILSENQAPYPETNVAGPSAPLAYNPASIHRPFPLDGTAWTPPARYRTGAELIRYTLDVNNDGVVNATDIASPEGADAAATPNPNDYVLVRQVYGDSTNNVAGDNGGTTERVALVRKPGDPGVPPMFNVYMRGSSTPWNWASGPVPPSMLRDIQRVEVQVTAASSRPDARGAYAQTTLKSEVNAARSVPDFGAPTVSVSGHVFNDGNTNLHWDGSPTDMGLPGATVRMGSYVAYTNSGGFYQLRVPAGDYTIRHTPPMGYGSFMVPDTFNLTVTNVALTRDFADTARAGGLVTMRAFYDENENGSWDGGEPPLQGIPFTIDPGSPGATTTVTDATGTATLFTAVGGYSLTCNAPDSLASVSPNPQSGSMSNGGTASHLFALAHQETGHIDGKVFVDANRDGVLGGSEAGLANVWVGASKDGGITVAGYAYTDGSGAYSISVPINDPPHTTAYSVYTVPPAGYFPTGSTSIDNLWVTANNTLSGNNFGLANFQIIRLTASRVLSLVSADLIENDWNGNHPENARHDQDLILGADAGGTDNVSVWFNRYNSSPLFNSTPTNPDGYTRLAPNSVMAMAVDTLDKNGTIARPDLVTGTRYTTNGNFFVWLTQGTNNNEGYLPAAYSQGYRTNDLGDVQAVLTLDVGGGSSPDILVGTKSPTAGQGSIEVWISDDAVTPTFSRQDVLTSISGTTIGEVTGMALGDLDNDGDKDLVVVTHTSDYNGQLLVFENRSRVSGSRFVLRYSVSFSGNAPTAVAVFDADGDGWRDIVVGTQRSTSQGNLYQFKNTGLSTLWTFTIPTVRPAPGIVMSLCAADFGGNAARKDLAVGYRTSTTGYGGGVVVYFMDLGVIPSTSTDPSAGSVINMVPALTSANFNYGLNTTPPPSPFLTDLAAGLKASATTGALVVFIR